MTADGDVHLTVPDMLWRLKNNGKSCNSCTAKDMDEVKRVNIIIHQLYIISLQL
jgi:hypothetical protein